MGNETNWELAFKKLFLLYTNDDVKLEEICEEYLDHLAKIYSQGTLMRIDGKNEIAFDFNQLDEKNG